MAAVIESGNWAGIEQDATDMQNAGINGHALIGCTSDNATWIDCWIVTTKGHNLLAILLWQ